LLKLVDDNPGSTVLVDLDGVTALDDAGLGMLLGAAGRARQRQGDLRLVCTAPHLLRRFEVTGLDRAVSVVE
jgi:anti-sigma B factor antagonist